MTTDPTPGLDLVQEIHALVKTTRDSQIAETFRPLVGPLAAIMSRQVDREDKRRAKASVKGDPYERVNVFALKQYLDLCKQLELDPKDPQTPVVLRRLQETIA